MAQQKKQTRTKRESGKQTASRDIVGAVPATHFDDPDAAGTDGARPKGRIARAARSVRGAISKLIHRGDHETPVATVAEEARKTVAPPTARTPRLQTDIPMEELDRVHMPQQASLKGSFRDDGRARQNDQEYASGVGESRWSDEDRYTNKSGDPRIGTHGRTYEAAERNRNDNNE